MTFLVAMPSLGKMLLELESLDFWRKKQKVNMFPLSISKFVTTKNCEQMKYVLMIKEFGYNLEYLLQNNKCNVL